MGGVKHLSSARKYRPKSIFQIFMYRGCRAEIQQNGSKRQHYCELASQTKTSQRSSRKRRKVLQGVTNIIDEFSYSYLGVSCFVELSHGLLMNTATKSLIGYIAEVKANIEIFIKINYLPCTL